MTKLTPTDPAELETVSYAEAMDELESILADLERSSVDVDELAHQVARASLLIRHCRGRIDRARLEVADAVDGLVTESAEESENVADEQ